MNRGRRGRRRGRERFLPNTNNTTVTEQDRNRANEAPARENTEDDSIKIEQLGGRSRDVLKRQSPYQEEAEQMALHMCKATYTGTKELRKWNRSDPVYCDVLTCFAPRVIATLGCSLTRASTQAQSHNGKGFKAISLGRHRTKTSTCPSANVVVSSSRRDITCSRRCGASTHEKL